MAVDRGALQMISCWTWSSERRTEHGSGAAPLCRAPSVRAHGHLFLFLDVRCAPPELPKCRRPASLAWRCDPVAAPPRLACGGLPTSGMPVCVYVCVCESGQRPFPALCPPSRATSSASPPRRCPCVLARLARCRPRHSPHLRALSEDHPRDRPQRPFSAPQCGSGHSFPGFCGNR